MKAGKIPGLTEKPAMFRRTTQHMPLELQQTGSEVDTVRFGRSSPQSEKTDPITARYRHFASELKPFAMTWALTQSTLHGSSKHSSQTWALGQKILQRKAMVED